NIAARLEALAEPGGICLSAKVLEEVRGKMDINVQDMGEAHLKNIARPQRIFRIKSGELSPSPPPFASLSGEIPSIAVLPLANMSGETEQQYFSDGIAEDIITELSRFRQIRVLARNSSFRFRGTDLDMISVGRELGVAYLVEGSVRRIGQRIRITVQL